MDSSASGGCHPAWVSPPDPKPGEAVDVDQPPNELLQEVLSYLPPSTLLRHCRPVCQRWRDVVDGWDLWRSILPWRHPDLWPVIRTCLPPADAPGPCILGRFCERRPIGRNLLRNSQSSRGLGGSPGKGPRGSTWEEAKGAGMGKRRGLYLGEWAGGELGHQPFFCCCLMEGFLNQTVPSAEAARGAEENARVGPLTAYRQRRLLSSYR